MPEAPASSNERGPVDVFTLYKKSLDLVCTTGRSDTDEIVTAILILAGRVDALRVQLQEEKPKP